MLPKFRKIWGPQEERISGGRRENLVKIGCDCFWQEQRRLPKFRKFWGPQVERTSGGRGENLVKIGCDCYDVYL